MALYENGWMKKVSVFRFGQWSASLLIFFFFSVWLEESCNQFPLRTATGHTLYIFYSFYSLFLLVYKRSPSVHLLIEANRSYTHV